MKNKKTIAFAMAAMSVAGTVVPSFASEVETENKTSVFVAEALGKKTLALKYDEVYYTNHTDDKRDDVLREGITVLQVKEKATTNEDGVYLVWKDLTKEEIDSQDGKAEKIKDSKRKLNQMTKDINKKLDSGKFELVSKVYTPGDGTLGQAWLSQDIKLEVTLKEKKTGNVYIYEFLNLPMGESVYYDENIIEEELNLNPLNTDDYRLLSEMIYGLEKEEDNFSVSKKELNANDLEIDVYRNGENKKHLVAKVTLRNVTKLDEKQFKRIPGKNDFNGHWAEQNIFNAMYDEKVDISNEFRPNDGITRAEFIKIINNTLVENAEDVKAEKEYFADVEKGDWFYDEILIATGKGYIKGYEDGTFRPNEKISREEAALIIARLNHHEENKKEVDGVYIDTDERTVYIDDVDIAIWADGAVDYLNKNGILNGYEDGTFRPKNNITRAEALAMIKKI